MHASRPAHLETTGYGNLHRATRTGLPLASTSMAMSCSTSPKLSSCLSVKICINLVVTSICSEYLPTYSRNLQDTDPLPALSSSQQKDSHIQEAVGPVQPAADAILAAAASVQ